MNISAYFDYIEIEKLDISREVKTNKYALYHIDKNLENNHLKNIKKYKITSLIKLHSPSCRCLAL